MSRLCNSLKFKFIFPVTTKKKEKLQYLRALYFLWAYYTFQKTKLCHIKGLPKNMYNILTYMEICIKQNPDYIKN